MNSTPDTSSVKKNSKFSANSSQNENNNQELTPFSFNNHDLRAMTIDGEPWFIASDVCNILEMSNSRMTLSRLDDDEKGVSSIYTLGGKQNITIINESGLYSLVLGSRKPEAKEFKKWVTSEVLPQIRKTGTYQAPQAMTEKDMVLGYLAKIEENEKLLAINSQLALETKIQRETIEKQKPLVEHAKEVLDSDSLIAVSVIAQKLNVSPQELNRFLLNQGILKKVGKTYLLKISYVDKCLARTVSNTYKKSDGTTGSNDLLKWTEQGKKFIMELWKRAHNPNLEAC